jgi:DNA-binding LytR/AlgR family response regulator
MTALRVIAIDDEPLALRRLEWCLQDVPDVALIGKTGNPQRGFELIDQLGTLGGPDDAAMPEIVFVTAFDHFAVKAFAVSVVDYLLKPVERSRLIEALERARVRRELRGAHARVQELREIIDNLRTDRRGDSQKKYETELWIREGDARVRVPVEMIERLEADGDYVRLHVGQRVRLMRARLGDLAERLDPAKFVRVHRSEIVRHDLIAAIRRHESGRTFAVLSGGREVPVSRRYVSRVAHALRFRKQQHSA